MRDAVSRLIMNWDDKLADDIAAMNLYRDRSKDRRRAEIEALRQKVGTCSAPSGFDYVENALRGQWTLKCERGEIRVYATLAPTIPPRVQQLDVYDGARRSASLPSVCRN
jgi:hypothetical protein